MTKEIHTHVKRNNEKSNSSYFAVNDKRFTRRELERMYGQNENIAFLLKYQQLQRFQWKRRLNWTNTYGVPGLRMVYTLLECFCLKH